MEQAERGTKEVQINDKVTFVFWEYLQGRDRRAIQEVYASMSEIKSSSKREGNKVSQTGVVDVTAPGTVNALMQDETIRRIVKEIRAGEQTITDKEKILEFLLDMPEYDYDVAITAINELTSPKK